VVAVVLGAAALLEQAAVRRAKTSIRRKDFIAGSIRSATRTRSP